MKNWICDNCWRREKTVDTIIMYICKCGHPLREIPQESKDNDDAELILWEAERGNYIE